MATAITNVRVFDGQGLSEPGDLVLDHGLVGRRRAATSSDLVVDGTGCVALPGLIDTHAHVEGKSQLEEYARWGVTTVLDMGAPKLAQTLALKRLSGVPSVLSAGVSASGPNSSFIRGMGFPEDSAVINPDDAPRFVALRVAEGSDFIKILIDDPDFPGSSPLSLATVSALVTSAHAAGLLTIAHVVSGATILTALRAGVDVVTHTSLAGPIDDELAAEIRSRSAALSPTLGMMDGVIQAMADVAPLEYASAEATVRAFHDAGKTVLVGTDANTEDIPFNPAYGEAVHDELERLVRAGLTPAEALRGAGIAAAQLFRLDDRGEIHEGKRADVLLVEGDPLADITATRKIRGVWLRGEQVA